MRIEAGLSHMLHLTEVGYIDSPLCALKTGVYFYKFHNNIDRINKILNLK